MRITTGGIGRASGGPMTRSSTAVGLFVALAISCAAGNPSPANPSASGPSAREPSRTPVPAPAQGDECTTVAMGASEWRVCRDLSYEKGTDEHSIKVVEPATGREHVLVRARSTLRGACEPHWKGFAVDVDSLRYSIVQGRILVHLRYRRAQLETLHSDRACQLVAEKDDTRMLADKLGELRTLNLGFACTQARCRAVEPALAAQGTEERWLELPEWR